MKNLWTPWRMEHVLGKAPKVSGCLFEPPGKTPHDRKMLLLYRSDHSVILLNRFPYANGHLLIALTRHVSSLAELSSQESAELMKSICHSEKIVTAELKCDGFNIGCNIGEIAGAGIADHLHFHLVPRWRDDHNFMTVVSEIRAIPEHINATFDRLLPHFQKI